MKFLIVLSIFILAALCLVAEGNQEEAKVCTTATEDDCPQCCIEHNLDSIVTRGGICNCIVPDLDGYFPGIQGVLNY